MGWNVTYVPPEDGVPGWAFTIGLTHSYGSPEFIMCGLSRDLLHGFVNIVGEMAAEGQPSPGLGRLGDVIEGHDVELRPVDPSWHRCLVGWALWFAQHDEPEFVQIVWPDNQGHFPNEPEFDESLRRFQPDLGAPPWHHRLDAWRASAANLAWPWASTSDHLAYVSRSIMEDGAPVLAVAHDVDGDWHFLDSAEEDLPNSSIVLSHVLHVLVGDPSLDVHIDLPRGSQAWRESSDAPWLRRGVVADGADESS
jgi:hypothetical protein